MSRLLVMACGAKKAPRACPASELYRGSAYAVLRRNRPPNLPVLILSAEHGLIESDRELEPYDRKMDEDRAAHFCRVRYVDAATLMVAEIPGWPFGEVFFHGGQLYRQVIERYADAGIFGRGAGMRYSFGRIGEQLAQLKRFLREAAPPGPSLWRGRQ